jgi:formylglycine-generating enzyme required for sulfatase activity
MIQNAKSIFNLKFEEITKMLKALHYYTEDQVVEKINALEEFSKENQLQDPRLNKESLLESGKEIRLFYDKLWEYKYQKDWKPFYQELSPQTKKIFHIEEMKMDGEDLWKIKNVYLDFYHLLSKNEMFLKHEIKNKIEEHNALAKTNILMDHQKVPTWSNLVESIKQKIIIEENLKVNHVEFKMISCFKNGFWMGIDANAETLPCESPKNYINMSKRFAMSDTLVTQPLWEEVMGWIPWNINRGNHLPIVNITWYDCLSFCNQLSLIHGYQPCFILSKIQKDDQNIIYADVKWDQNANGYRLPTEAEWEFYAKADLNLTYSISNDSRMIFGHKMESVYLHEQGQMNEVKAKKANHWGFYDMCGNVFQWCMDQWDMNLYHTRNHMDAKDKLIDSPIVWQDDLVDASCGRVIRGGCFRYNYKYSRVNFRIYHHPDEKDFYLGFRLCHNVSEALIYE